MMLVGFSYEPAKTATPQSSNKTDEQRTKQAAYDGNWWLAAESGERTGFLDGTRDCLVWVADAKLPRDIDNLEEKIGQYYKTHPNDRSVAVSTIWQKVSTQGPPATPRPAGGEVYTNPHGYYDGEFWREGSELANRGFLEGYIWCMRTCVKEPADTYSRSIDYYFDKIWDYIEKHPGTAKYNEPIATILSRFHDRPKPK